MYIQLVSSGEVSSLALFFVSAIVYSICYHRHRAVSFSLLLAVNRKTHNPKQKSYDWPFVLNREFCMFLSVL